MRVSRFMLILTLLEPVFFDEVIGSIIIRQLEGAFVHSCQTQPPQQCMNRVRYPQPWK